MTLCTGKVFVSCRIHLKSKSNQIQFILVYIIFLFSAFSWAILHHQYPEEPTGAKWHPGSPEAAARGGAAAGSAERPAQTGFQTNVSHSSFSLNSLWCSKNILWGISHMQCVCSEIRLFVLVIHEHKKPFPFLLHREEQDFEYARVIQEELQRRAEEVHRREQDDEVSVVHKCNKFYTWKKSFWSNRFICLYLYVIYMLGKLP